MNKIARIRSGGQSGVDRAALDIGKELNIPICGWCPKGGWAEDYTSSPGLLVDYPLKETPLEDVEQRTEWNVRDSHATLIILPHGVKSNGSEFTKQMAKKYKRPYHTINKIEDLDKTIEWLNHLGNGLTLNVAGPRKSESKLGYLLTSKFLSRLIQKVNS